MPRDGTETYVLPFPDVVEDTTIESTVYNGFTNDVAQDLNTPRPISAGGTGATTAHDAMIALSGEIAKQGPVTNYDSFPFINGSFSSNPGATAAPSVNSFIGTFYGHINPDYADVEARDISTGLKYLRRKIAGVWSAWVAQAGSTADLDAAYVNVAGDTMTGTLYVNSAIVAVSSAVWSQITATTGTYQFGSSGSKSLVFDGTNFTINGGNFICSNGIIANGNVHAYGGIYYYNNAATIYSVWDGISITFSHQIHSNSHVIANTNVYAGYGNTQSGTYVFGNDGTRYLTCSGGNYSFGTGSVNMSSDLIVAGQVLCNGGRIISKLNSDNPSIGAWSTTRSANYGFWTADQMYFGSMDGSGTPTTSYANLTSAVFGISGSTANKPGGGTWTAPSDARVKNVLGDYISGLDAVAALQPVRYTYKGNDTTEPPKNTGIGIPTDETKSAPSVPYPNSLHYGVAVEAKEFIGLVAQQAEVTMPELVTKAKGYIDGTAVTDLRNLDTGSLVFALINAVKELKARVEMLEAR